ncbi:Peroxidase [Mycena chlorophos]|uniref:Peroxidase n=1 Tax=Mycena chlorophos TaxID=658473 RepID=A0A8H6WGQ5_MYCCL|nr:Peroxidase [Mycena chlorophos]
MGRDGRDVHGNKGITKPLLNGVQEFTADDDNLIIQVFAQGKNAKIKRDLFRELAKINDRHKMERWENRYYTYRQKFDALISAASRANANKAKVVRVGVNEPGAGVPAIYLSSPNGQLDAAGPSRTNADRANAPATRTRTLPHAEVDQVLQQAIAAMAEEYGFSVDKVRSVFGRTLSLEKTENALQKALACLEEA